MFPCRMVLLKPKNTRDSAKSYQENKMSAYYDPIQTNKDIDTRFRGIEVSTSKLKDCIIDCCRYMENDLIEISKWLSSISYSSTDPSDINDLMRKNCDFMLDVEDTAKLYDLLRYNINILDKKRHSKPNVVEMIDEFYRERHPPRPWRSIYVSGDVITDSIPIHMASNSIVTYFGDHFYVYNTNHDIMTSFDVAYRNYTFPAKETVYSFYVHIIAFYLTHEERESIIFECYPNSDYVSFFDSTIRVNHTDCNTDTHTQCTHVRLSDPGNHVRSGSLRSTTGAYVKISI